MKKLKLAVLFGGKSSEYEVSLTSASAVLANLSAEKYDVVRIGITKAGAWYRFEGAISAIADGSWCRDTSVLPRVLVDPNPASHAVSFLSPDGRTETCVLDAAFPVLHGAFGEDGTLQGLFAMAGIPTVGCGCLSSALCMDKAMAKAVLRDAGVLQARAVIVRARAYAADPEAVLADASVFGFPVFVKPSRAGSSVGVSRASSPAELRPAIEGALREDEKVLVEEAITGKEVEVAVLEEHGTLTVSMPAEIEPGADFYDYDTKYNSDVAKFYVPARLPAAKLDEVRVVAAKVFRALDCTGLARVDFFVRENGDVVLNEVNTLPGFTPISMYPKLMIAAGLTYGELLDRLVAAAL